MFDLQNKKNRLQQRFDAFRKEVRAGASKKISDVVVKNAAVIDLSRVARRSAETPRSIEWPRGEMPVGKTASVVFPKQESRGSGQRQRKEFLPAAGLPLPEKPNGKKKNMLWLWSGIGAAVFASAFLLLTFAFVRATVTVTPAEEHFLLKGVSLSVDTSLHSLDAAGKRLPGFRIEVMKSAQETFPTSGKKYVQSRAQGVITVTNNYSVKSQPLVQNTRFVEAGGKVFHLVRGTTIPGMAVKNGKAMPSSVDVEVIADQPGNGYNLPPTNFKIPGFVGAPKYDKFSAASHGAFTGGYIGETRFATDDDIRAASEQVTKEAYDAVKIALAGKIPSGFAALDGARLIQITDVKKPLGLMIGGSFDFFASADGFVILFKQSDLTQLLETVAVPPDKAMSFEQDKSQITFSKVAMRRDGTGFDAVIDGDALFRHRIDANEIAAKIISLSRGGASQLLKARRDIASFEIKIFPSWVGTIPASASSVSVEERLH